MLTGVINTRKYKQLRWDVLSATGSGNQHTRSTIPLPISNQPFLKRVPIQQPTKAVSLVPTAEDLLSRPLPEKDPLIDGLLYRRDIVALAGRRRHGKTNFLFNLTVAVTMGRPDFINHPISKTLRVLSLFLEDDSRELQGRLQKLLGSNSTEGRLRIITREDLFEAGITVDVGNRDFKSYVDRACGDSEPDIIVFDNMAHLIGGDYNKATRVDSITKYAWQLARTYNAAIIIAVHPRKRSRDSQIPTLREDPESFFEEVMGSSHFINSCGSLWGLERNYETDYTDFLGGAQRYTGQQSIAMLAKGEDDWLHVVSDIEVNLEFALNTSPRKQAWKLLPDNAFTYMEGVAAVKPVMRSQSTFHAWWTNFLIRLGLVVKQGDKYIKAKGASMER